jgi:peptide/nickel transport system substrate-binding protein
MRRNPPTSSAPRKRPARRATSLGRSPKPAALTATVASILACGLVSACAGSGTGTLTAASKPVYGGTITYGADREPTCLDPHNTGDMPQTYIARQYLDSLVSELPDGRVVGWLATSWTISPDGKTYTFAIKHGVKFTDGTPLNAQAVVDNFTQELDPKTQSSTDWGYLEPYYSTSKALNEYTVQLSLKRPDSPLLDELAQAFFGIESPKAMARGLTTNCQSPVGTGPFVVKQWQHGQSITLVRNQGYNSAPANARHQGQAYLNEIVWRFLEEPSVRFAALENGEANLIFNIPPEDQTAAQKNPQLTVQQFVHSGQPNNVTLNAAQAPFNELAVRQAFLYGANTAAAVKSAFFGAYPAQTTVLSTGTPYYDASLANQYAYNPAKANQLLDKAGWTGRNGAGYRTKNGKVLTVGIPYSSNTGDTPPEVLTLLQDIQAAEAKIGFDVKLEPTTESAVYQMLGSYNPTAFNALADSYWNSPTPAVLYIVYSKTTKQNVNPNNQDYDDNPSLDNILLQAAATTDRTQQQALYSRAEQIAGNEAWELDLYPVTTDLGIGAGLHGVWIEPSEGEPVLSDAWLAK